MEQMQTSQPAVWAPVTLDRLQKINKLVSGSMIIYKQCFVLKFLADSLAHYVENWWITVFQEETRSSSAEGVAEEIIKVLNSGLQLLQIFLSDKYTPSITSIILGGGSEFHELVDDVRIYSQMMNRLIAVTVKNPFSQNPYKQHLIEQLRYKVEFDFGLLHSALRWASEEDKVTLLQSLKSSKSSPGILYKWLSRSHSEMLGSLSGAFLASGLLPTLETRISDRDIQLEEDLGSGSFAQVKKAICYKLPVAIKIFPNQSWLEEELKVFRKLLAANSSHVVQLIGHCELKSTMPNCLVLELMDTDLKKLIEKRKIVSPDSPFSLLESTDIMIQIAKAMHHLHTIDVVYRDMKPSNVLFTIREDGTVLIKLADFGISKANFLTLNSFNTIYAGTMMYMAPEILEGRDRYSRKVDVYSFGMLCSEILTGRQPFSIEQHIDEIRRLVKEGKRPLLPKDIPGSLKMLVEACWKYEEHYRPSFADICDDLWLVKERALIKKGDLYKLNYQITELGLIKLRRMNHSICMMPQISTSTGKKAIYYYNIKSPYAGYYVRQLPINIMVDIIFSYLDIKSSGRVEVLDPWTTLENPFTSGSGVDPQNVPFQDATGNSGVLGQFKKLLKDQGKKFNLALAIGGWEHSKYFSDAFSTPETRSTFVTSILDLLKIYPIFNGLVIDWLYVSSDGMNYGKLGNKVRKEDGDNFILLLKQLREVLPSGFTIAACASGFPEKVQWPIERAIYLLDQLYLKTHEFHDGGTGAKITAHMSNLYHSSHGKWSVDETVKNIMSRGVPPSKIFITSKLMSCGFANTDGLGCPANGASSNGHVEYKALPVEGSEEHWDDEAKAAYAYDPIKRTLDSYEDVLSMIEKAKYIKANNLGGIVIWEACRDFPPNHARSIASALHDHLTHG